MLPWTAALLLSGCGTFRGYQGPDQFVVPRDPARPTILDQRLAGDSVGQPVVASGVSLLVSGEDALLARLALAELAGRSIDIQTYIWELDTAGRIVLGRLIAAADRGVRVRLLLDDTTTLGGERVFAALDEHPNVEVRFFNPFRTRSSSWARRGLEFLFDFARLNRRMHNKAWIADDCYLIVGGRNIADHYFLISEELNFRDLDLLVGGPAVREATAGFDRYWNSRWAVPAQRLARPGENRIGALRRRLARFGAEQVAFPVEPAWTPEVAARKLADSAPLVDWSVLEVLADEPEKIENGGGSAIAERLAVEARALESEMLVETAYLSLPASATDVLAGLVERGVRIRFLTNSLATTDVIAAHAGYVGTRRRLLLAGVEVYELRPGGHIPGRHVAPPSGSQASLHSKAAVYDRRAVYVGSLNLDPRSIEHNTELGIWIRDPVFAERVARVLERGYRSDASWRVERRERRVMSASGAMRTIEETIWIGRRADGSEEIRTREPRAGVMRRLLARLLSWLPIESLI